MVLGKLKLNFLPFVDDYCRILRFVRKQKILIPFGNQDFTVFCFSSKWCHQKTSSISKWLYIFALKNRNKHNLPLFLHLNSAPFCSVSQSRVPTLMQRYIIIVIYKWELQSYFFIISSIRHFTASSKPFLIPCDNP